MIMADQDPDGSHIKGLLINLFHYYWPNLLKHPGFLQEFATPIVKARKKNGKTEIPFFTLQEYEEWRQEVGEGLPGWHIKYYKGLGTSSSQEAKEYFSNLPLHVMDFSWEGAESGEVIEMVFSKKRADDRKAWLLKYEADLYVDHNVAAVSYSDFVNKELIHFSMMDNMRSIPSLVDGLKPGQRKILFACFKRKLKAEIKVAQLAGYVAEHSAYHHGEQSLAMAIINMAQTFVGSNNLNTLVPKCFVTYMHACIDINMLAGMHADVCIVGFNNLNTLVPSRQLGIRLLGQMHMLYYIHPHIHTYLHAYIHTDTHTHMLMLMHIHVASRCPTVSSGRGCRVAPTPPPPATSSPC